jgi:hypothetical protein
MPDAGSAMITTDADAETAAVAWLRREYGIEDPAYPISALVQRRAESGWDVHISIGSGAYMPVRVTCAGHVARLPASDSAPST